MDQFQITINGKVFTLDLDFVVIDEVPKRQGDNWVYKVKAISKELKDNLNEYFNI